MKNRLRESTILLVSMTTILLAACNALLPLNGETAEAPNAEPSAMPQQGGFPDQPAIPNDSGIEGVQTFPDKYEYHNHVTSLPEPDGTIPPPFGVHFSAWQNCGIYEKPVGLGNALHSMEHGAVWLTYALDLNESQIADLQNLARGHDYVLMSPYPPQTDPVVLTAWGVQLVIDSLPDDRIAKFIDYYELGPQNPEPGAPCSGAVGNPLP